MLTPLLLSLTLLSAPPRSGAGMVPLPLGVADVSGRTGFVQNSTGGIDALDLLTGDRLWSSDQARIPVLVVGDRLYGLLPLAPNQVRVVGFDLLERGKI